MNKISALLIAGRFHHAFQKVIISGGFNREDPDKPYYTLDIYTTDSRIHLNDIGLTANDLREIADYIRSIADLEAA